MSGTERNYLLDLGFLLREGAIKAGQRAAASRGTPDAVFESGRAMAYYEVVTLVLSQAEAFGIGPEAFRLEGFDPEHEVLRGLRPPTPPPSGRR